MSFTVNSAAVALTLPGGAAIVVPDDLTVSTTYVLREQEDWFEDEIRFLRALIKPGMRALDIGANFGVYTLALAHAVGAEGRVWAVEPGREAAEYLARSLAANAFTHVELFDCALSRSDGRGYLESGLTPELRRLVASNAASAVTVRALDSLAREHAIERVDFVKIDVEGEEANVLAGAADFLKRESPLLMLEFWGDRKFNMEIFEPLQRAGYDTFKLIPGINVLAPFYESEEPDPYQLNLFACREPRLAALAGENRLVAAPALKPPAITEPALEKLLALPYAQGHAPAWLELIKQHSSESPAARHLRALRHYYAAHDHAYNAIARLWALEQSYLALRELVQSRFTPERAASFVRVAADFGQRAEAISICRRLVGAIAAGDATTLAEPFLAPWAWHESIDPGAEAKAWLLACALEAYEHLFQFSSSDKPALAQEALNVRVDARFLSPAYARRESLFQKRRAALAQRIR